MGITEWVGSGLIFLGMFFVALGVLGIYRFNHFYPRALAASKVDTVGYITTLIGICVKEGFSSFTLKTAAILIITLLINPLVTHSVVRSAYISGYKPRKEQS